MLKALLNLLSPIAPHIAEELWENLVTKKRLRMNHGQHLMKQTGDDEVEIVVQINGKVKHKLIVPTDTNKEQLEQIAMGDDNIKEQIDGKTIRKVIAVPGKLVNIVAN